MGTYSEDYYLDIKLIDSIVKDSDGNQISISHDEWHAINGASGGPATAVNPLTTKSYVDEAVASGKAWKAPVDTVSSTEPTIGLSEGYRYINTVDHKIYTYETSNFDVGVSPEANWTAFSKDTDYQWTYDLDTTTWVNSNSGTIGDATLLVKGKVQVGSNISVTDGVISISDSIVLAGSFYESYVGVTNFEVAHNLGSTKLMVQVWRLGKEIPAVIEKKPDFEDTILLISLNGTHNIDVIVIALL